MGLLGSFDEPEGFFSGVLYLISCFGSSGFPIKSGSISSSESTGFDSFLATAGADDFGFSSGFFEELEGLSVDLLGSLLDELGFFSGALSLMS